LNMNESQRNESAAWHDFYRSEDLRSHRTKTHKQKLAKLGLLSLRRDLSVLDVCCGTGEMLNILAAEGFTRLTGIDLEPLKGELNPSWEFRLGGADRLPFADASFDVIYCAHALHHLGSFEAIQSFWQEARRCLKPGGRLAVIDHYDSMQLRVVFGAWSSTFGKCLPSMRAFHFQLVEEKPYLYRYLDSWKKLNNFLKQNHFQQISIKKDAFFFYWNGYKPNE
jgi:ubiquinone/menaquinone biosynthesis C-methylase UbiE